MLASRTGKLGCRGFPEFVLAARRTAPPLNRRHPCWRTSAALAAPASQPFEGDNSFLYLLSLLAQISQHFHDIHFFSLLVRPLHPNSRSEIGTERPNLSLTQFRVYRLIRGVSSNLFCLPNKSRADAPFFGKYSWVCFYPRVGGRRSLFSRRFQ